MLEIGFEDRGPLIFSFLYEISGLLVGSPYLSQFFKALVWLIERGNTFVGRVGIISKFGSVIVTNVQGGGMVQARINHRSLNMWSLGEKPLSLLVLLLMLLVVVSVSNSESIHSLRDGLSQVVLSSDFHLRLG